MKKQIWIFVFLMAAFVKGMAQENTINLDTIYANDKMNVALIFPEPIRQGITGSEEFVFTYNREKEQHLGLLQAIPGEVSNLLVISTTGSIFSYIVKYSEELEKLNYFIAETGKIGNEIPELSEKLIEGQALFSDAKAEKEVADYQDFSSHLLRSKQRIGKLRKRKDGVELKVQNILFHNSELYFVLEINNNSPIDYEPAFLNVSVETRKQGRKKSIQKLPVAPVYKHQVPEMIPQKKTSRFVYVLPKFSIAEDKIVVIDLKEQQGERDIKLKIKKRFINNPN
ncbi:conjugative transposon protein TraN [Salegentibacter mishustinae]|uniref:DUF4138 domain-containing protein n=1 Tax=Salegentibacter mishustinae TaxID=270918 RepID=UPI001CE09714|nr:DUF4138 domain-containing protein [Salegentibacter mishustinae]UBZ08778.1 conjugative transposon protein TraN [Salegentibacter mishustinae]